MTRYRYRFVADPDYTPTGCDGHPLPESEAVYADNQCLRPDGTPIPYAEYLRYYGDPEAHLGVAVFVDRMTPTDDDWTVAESLHGIDLMFDDADVGLLGEVYYRLEDIPAGYLHDTAAELHAETEAGRS